MESFDMEYVEKLLNEKRIRKHLITAWNLQMTVMRKRRHV